MNKEIKEILDRLKRIDHNEYSCGFEFADSGSFDECCRCFEERKIMADYITNLQQENKVKTIHIETLNEILNYENIRNDRLQEENKILKEIINEAKAECISVIGNPEHTIVSKNKLMKILLNILKGSDENEC